MNAANRGNKTKLKRALILVFILLAVQAAAILAATEIILLRPDSVQQSIAETFNRIKNELEFKGLNASVKDMAKEYNELFEGYSNVIITDDTGTIQFSTNNGYISEKGKFLVLVDPWKANGYGSNMAFLIDSKNNIRYSAQMDLAINTSGLKEASSRNPLSKMLFAQTEETFDTFADREITNNDGTKYIISVEPNIILDYEYIASKGLNLYSVFDSEHQYSNYYRFGNSIKAIRHGLVLSVLAFYLISCILLAMWVFQDSHGHRMKTKIWVIVVFLMNAIGLGIYLLARPKSNRCGTCNRPIDDDWILCPYCGEKPGGKKTE